MAGYTLSGSRTAIFILAALLKGLNSFKKNIDYLEASFFYFSYLFVYGPSRPLKQTGSKNCSFSKNGRKILRCNVGLRQKKFTKIYLQ